MAYDAYRKHRDAENDTGAKHLEESNPYSSLLGAPPPTAASDGQPQANGPTATGFVNFGDIANANSGVSQRQAGRLQGNAEQKAQKAQQGLTGAQSAFSAQVRTGTNQGPSASDYGYASGKLGFYRPPGAADVKRATSNGPNVSETQEGLASTETRNGPVADPTALNAPSPDSVNAGAITEADWRARVEQGAQSGYSGPSSLTDLAEYEKLLQDSQEAGKVADGLGTRAGIQAQTGGTALDAALIGGAGRPGFSRVQQQYGGGKLMRSLDDAVVGSKADVARAKQQTATNQDAYAKLLEGYDRYLAGKAKVTEQKAPIVIGAAPGVGNTPTTLGYVAAPADSNTFGDTTQSELRQRQWGGKQTYEEAKTPGNEWLQGTAKQLGYTADDMDLIRQAMTPEDWAAFQRAASYGDDHVKAWFKTMMGKVKAK